MAGRGRSGGLRRGLRRPVRRRRRLLRRQGVPVHGGRPLGRARRACASTSAPAASSPSRCAAGRARRSGSRCTATTSPTPRSSAALRHGVGRIVVDSFDEIDRVARGRGRGSTSSHPCWCGSPSGSRRTPTSTSRPRTRTRSSGSPGRRSGRRGGPPRSCDHARAARAARACTATSASQIFDIGGFEVAARRVLDLHAARRPRARGRAARARPRRRLRHRLHHRARPAAADGPRRRAWPRSSARACRADGVGVPRISIEPGRAIAGPSTFTLYEVGTVKDGPARRRRARALYVSVDGGMSDNIRTALYDADYSCTAGQPGQRRRRRLLARVVGKHCESGDIVVKDEFLPGRRRARRPARRPRHRRLLPQPVQPVQPRPPAARWSRSATGTARVIVRRETIEDLLALDVD